MAKHTEKNVIRTDRVVFFASDEGVTKNYCEVLDVSEVVDDRIITKNAGYVLPLADAKVFNSPDGLVYAYNIDLPYLKEISHLAEVEKNMIVEQAFLYAGRSNAAGKTSMFTWVVLAGLFLMTMIGMFK